MTNQDLFRAVGEVREEQITDAEMKKTTHWHRYLTAAACFAVMLAALVLPEQLGHRESADQGAGDIDGNEYSTAGTVPESADAKPEQTEYSVGAEIGELDDRYAAIKPPWSGDSSPSLAWLEPKEIFAMDTVIFRGTVQDLRYFRVKLDGATMDYTVASVEVTDCVRGGLEKRDIHNILLPCAPGRSISTAGDLEKLEKGSDAVFMPYRVTVDTGWRSGEDYFCYADLAELYFGEGIRFLFLDTGEGLSFARDVYTDIAGAEMLDEVVDYLRATVPDDDEPPEAAEEVFPRAGEVLAEPLKPQTDPADTANASDSGQTAHSPSGARELPGGAAIGAPDGTKAP